MRNIILLLCVQYEYFHVSIKYGILSFMKYRVAIFYEIECNVNRNDLKKIRENTEMSFKLLFKNTVA